MSLRAKLLLVGLIVLTLPVAGWQIVRETERFLRLSQERSVRSTVASIASAIAVSHEWSGESQGVYVRSLTQPVLLDGYSGEWSDWFDQAQALGDSASLLAAGDDRYLYLLIRVTDERVLYSAQPGSRDADHLLVHTGEELLEVTTTAPGWVAAPLRGGRGTLRGEWQESPTGYTVELRLPVTTIGAQLGVAVVDVDRRGEPAAKAGTGPGEDPAAPAPLVMPDPVASGMLAALTPPDARVWLVNDAAWVIGHADLRDPGPAAASNARDRWLRTLIYRNLLASPMSRGPRRGSDTIRLAGPEVESALAGDASLRWETSSDGETVSTIAAAPVRVDGAVAGAAVLEQPGDALLLLANEAVMNLLGLTLAAFVLTGIGLFSYATVLVLRIRRLHRAVAGAVSKQGHLAEEFPRSRSGDELGDLHRAFADMHQRLRQYTGYLETLTQKLAHELRTPLAVVRSSLDNLEEARLDSEQRGYARRAREGAERLSAMVQAMTEAGRLEQLIEDAEPERFSLRAVVEGCCRGYIDLYDQRRFEMDLPPSECMMRGVPELIAQMLDKLVDNAVDFSPDGGWVCIRLAAGPQEYILGVSNQGPALPEGMGENLFDSLVSLRRGGKADRPHLGLGLYIVRMIAAGHGGGVTAHDLPGGQGVEFRVRFPAEPDNSE